MRVLLFNPPGDLPYLRGGYCSGVSKGKYYYPAIDLLVQSGYLADHFQVSVYDAIMDKASPEHIIQYLKQHPADVILAVTAHCSWKTDLDMMHMIADHFPGIRLFLTGGYLLFQGQEILKTNDYVEGILLDFTSESFVSYLRDKTISDGSILLSANSEISRDKINSVIEYPCPRHELFPVRQYNLPFSRFRPLSVIHQSFGCPFHCSFCVFSNIDFQIRNTGNVLDELLYLKQLGVRELFFGDPTFAARPKQALELCDAMIQKNMNFSWFCQTRTDVLNHELIEKMKHTGCHTIQFGVETTGNEMQKEYKKRLDLSKATEIFRECKKQRIRILGSIIIGLPGDTKQNIFDTLDYMIRQNFDYVSVNIAAPEVGTSMRQESLDKGFFSLDTENNDLTHLTPLLDTPQLSKSDQWDLRNTFVKRFYLRPSYILKRAVSARSWTELANLFREGLHLAKSTLK